MQIVFVKCQLFYLFSDDIFPKLTKNDAEMYHEIRIMWTSLSFFIPTTANALHCTYLHCSAGICVENIGDV